MMAVYQCEKCLEPICKRDAMFCTSCGQKISNPIPQKLLIDGKKKVWNVGLIAFWCVWGLGGVALLINAHNSSTFIVLMGVIGLVSGGIYISKSGSIVEVKSILIDSLAIRCSNDS